MPFLDQAYLNDFRNTINSSSIFEKSDKLKEKYNLICVVMDRLESAIRYLNNRDDYPRTEEEFVCFLVYACMVRDGIMKLYENVFRKKPDFVDQKKYFKHVKLYSKDAFTDENCPTDDVFFEYLRSMVFAHPFDTSHRNGRLFFEKQEKQYCPWVIVRDEYVGIRVYTSSDKFIINDLTFPFDTLKEYITSVYEQLKEINEWAKDEINFQDEEWKKHKVDRSGSVNELLNSIKAIYSERFLELYEIERIESFLNCECSNPSNKDIVQEYRVVLIEGLYKISDALDTGDYDALDEVINSIFLRPRKAHQMMSYQLEKIFCYLDDDHYWMDTDWGLRQANAFSREFAKDWVVIEVNNMGFDEIKLLVSIACYKEAKKQGL